MNPVETRLLATVPADFAVQKCKCKRGRPEGSISCDLVVQDLASVPNRSVYLVNLKGLTTIAELTKTPFHTEGLILNKKLKISDDELDTLKKAWGVRSVFDLRNKATKDDVRKLKKAFQNKNTSDLNKVVVNPKCRVAKKAKITFSDSLLPVLLTLVEEGHSPMKSVESWKFVIDFQETHKTEFSRFVKDVEVFKRIKTKKCTFSTEQAAQMPPSKPKSAVSGEQGAKMPTAKLDSAVTGEQEAKMPTAKPDDGVSGEQSAKMPTPKPEDAKPVEVVSS